MEEGPLRVPAGCSGRLLGGGGHRAGRPPGPEGSCSRWGGGQANRKSFLGSGQEEGVMFREGLERGASVGDPSQPQIPRGG